MEKAVYPYKFIPVLKERVWGGSFLTDNSSECKPLNPIGERWDICGFEGDSSLFEDGFLADNQLYDVIETYMDEIVGEDNYKRFGNEFPILVKTLDIQGLLSVQVHPDDDTAFDRHNSYGKNEAWYVLEAKPDAKIYLGFKKDITAEEFLNRCAAGTLEEVLNVFTPKKGDFFFIPEGTVHSAGNGLVIAEIQQLSDVTYRIYDWGRENDPATAREMHLDLALCCIDYRKFDIEKNFKPAADDAEQKGISREIPPRRLVSNRYFTATEHYLSDAMHIYTEKFESFILYTCTSGSAVIVPEGEKKEYTLQTGEWIMIPAGMKDFLLKPTSADTKVMEVFIEKEEDMDGYVETEEQGEDCGCHEHHHGEDCGCGCHGHEHSHGNHRHHLHS